MSSSNCGHLFQGRFGLVGMDEQRLMAAFRYVAVNPVKAKLVTRPVVWRWSSNRAHINGEDAGLVNVGPLQDRVADVPAFFESDAPQGLEQALSLG